MAIQRYRYRMTGATSGLANLASKSDPATLAAVGQSQGQIIDFDIDTTTVSDLDEALADFGYVRIAGPGVVGTPGDAAEFVRRSGDNMDSAANITFSSGGSVLGLPLTPTNPTDAASKNYVDAMVVSGRIWREALLVKEQLLNGGSGGLLQAMAGYFAGALTAGDTVTITDGTTPETWTGVSPGPPVAFQFVVAVSAAADMAAFIAAVNNDSTLWKAIATSGIDEYFAAVPSAQFVVARKAASIANDRMYGTLTSAANIKVVEFATKLQDYTTAAGTESNLPAADPAAKRFGLGRLYASLITVETHFIVEDVSQWTWDADDNIWRLTGGSAAGSCHLLWGADDVASTITIRYLFPSFSDSIAQVSAVEYRVPRNGTFRNIRARHNIAGAAATNITYTLMVNGVATALAVALAANAVDASNLASSVVVSAGDLVVIRVTKAAALVGTKPSDIVVSLEFTS